MLISVAAHDALNLVVQTESEEMDEFLRHVSPAHILAYATGANRVPAAGFSNQPKIRFIHDDTKVHPTANTCSCELGLMVNERTITDQFHTTLTVALMNGTVFSTI